MELLAKDAKPVRFDCMQCSAAVVLPVGKMAVAELCDPCLAELVAGFWAAYEAALCTDCRVRAGEMVTDPYEMEINDREVRRVMCPECYQDRKDDI